MFGGVCLKNKRKLRNFSFFFYLDKKLTDGREGLCARLFGSKRLSSTILTSMSDLQEALGDSGNHKHTRMHTQTNTPKHKQTNTHTHRPPQKNLVSFVSRDSSPPLLLSVACASLSRLLDLLLDQSESSLSSCGVKEETLSSRMRLGLSSLTSLQSDTKVAKHKRNSILSEKLSPSADL